MTLDLATGRGGAASLDGSGGVGLDATLTSGRIVRDGASRFGRGSLGVGIRVPR